MKLGLRLPGVKEPQHVHLYTSGNVGSKPLGHLRRRPDDCGTPNATLLLGDPFRIAKADTAVERPS